jgi:hypothetical protein
MKRLIKSNTTKLRKVRTSEIEDILREVWSNNISLYSHNDYVKYFNNLGIDISDQEQFDIAWDYACGDAEEVEDVLTINGIEFYDTSDAQDWLNEQIKEYGNTYYFPSRERSILNQLIEKFGNTYFWTR